MLGDISSLTYHIQGWREWEGGCAGRHFIINLPYSGVAGVGGTLCWVTLPAMCRVVLRERIVGMEDVVLVVVISGNARKYNV